jgi:hypothetical protein
MCVLHFLAVAVLSTHAVNALCFAVFAGKAGAVTAVALQSKLTVLLLSYHLLRM